MDDDARGAIVHTTGNPERHLVLRGGGGRTNFDAAAVAEAAALCAARQLPSRVMVDCSHGNSSKDPSRQPVVFREVLDQVIGGSPHIMGSMVESHLHSGSQKLGRGTEGLVYGVSVTDACIDWETTERMLREADARLRAAGMGMTPPPRKATGS